MSNRNRNWFLTINNPTNEDVRIVLMASNCQERTKYAIWSCEHEEEGTPHIHFLLCLKQPLSFSSMKRMFPRADIEIPRNPLATINYIKKDGFWQDYGTFGRPVGAAKEDADARVETLKLVRMGQKRISEFTEDQLMDSKLMRGVNTVLNTMPGPRRMDLHVHVFVSPTGWGKTSTIYNVFGEADIGTVDIAPGGIWFQATEAKVMLFDEFCGQIRATQMLRLLQEFPLCLPVKGGHRPCYWRVIFICSNTPPERWWSKVDFQGNLISDIPPDVREAFYRRIGYGSFPSTDRVSTHIFSELTDTVDSARQVMADVCTAEFDRLFPVNN